MSGTAANNFHPYSPAAESEASHTRFSDKCPSVPAVVTCDESYLQFQLGESGSCCFKTFSLEVADVSLRGVRLLPRLRLKYGTCEAVADTQKSSLRAQHSCFEASAAAAFGKRHARPSGVKSGTAQKTLHHTSPESKPVAAVARGSPQSVLVYLTYWTYCSCSL